ncbi:MAG: S8 family serine peptidase [Planctomycetes bacterium]|nr:S8 family serine peptidase [Planctomycetota bacterium]
MKCSDALRKLVVPSENDRTDGLAGRWVFGMIVGLAVLVVLSAGSTEANGQTTGSSTWVGTRGAWGLAPGRPIVGVRESSGYVTVQPKAVERMVAEGSTASFAGYRRRRAVARLAGYRVTALEHGPTGRQVIRVPFGYDEQLAAAELMATGDYEFAEPDWIVYPDAIFQEPQQPTATPDDPYFYNQWQLEAMNCEAAWSTTTGDPSFVVAICDTGIDETHPDLAANRLTGYNAADGVTEAEGGAVSDVQGHGTMTAGCAAAIGNNGVGVSGTGWDLRHMTVRVTNASSGAAYMSDLTAAVMWAADNGARVINVSYSGVDSAAVQAAGAYARQRGALVVWAAGNEARYLEGDHPDVIVVAATDENDAPASFSNYGPLVDCAAPGVRIVTTGRGGTYVSASGTSFSAPLTAGACAMIWSAQSDLTPDDVEQALLAGADDVYTPGRDDHTGVGRVNVGESVNRAGEWAPIYEPYLTVTPSSPVVGTWFYVTLGGARPGDRVGLFYGTHGTVEPRVVARYGVTLDLRQPRIVAGRAITVNDNGQAAWRLRLRKMRRLPAGIWFQAVQAHDDYASTVVKMTPQPDQ